MIYLDNASTSWPKPQEVLESIHEFLRGASGNPGRGGHAAAAAATHVVEDVRARLARLIGADDASRVVHCLNGTDALNIAVKGTFAQGDHVVCTVLDHNSVSRPLATLVDTGVIECARVGVGADGFIDPDDVRKAWRPNTRLVIVPHASNVTGAIQPIAEIGRMARERDALFLVDAAQTAGLIPIDVRTMFVDLLAAPGHKALLGPTGTGFLYVGPRARVQPWREGGTGADSQRRRQPEEMPTALEAGTPNTVGIAGLRGALDWRDRQTASQTGACLAHERGVVRRVAELARELPGVRVAGSAPVERCVGVLSLVFERCSAAEAAAVLDASFDIQVRAGLHCSPFAHQALGTAPDGTVRLSPGPFSTMDEAERVCHALRDIASTAA